MDGMSQIKKLDVLLNLFKEEEVNISITFIPEMMKGKGIKVSKTEMKRFLDQLLADKFIMLTSHEHYCIRIEGILFEGYEQKIINDAYENTLVEKLKFDQKVNQTNMTRLTVLIAFGTLVAAVYYLMEILDKFSPVFHEHGYRLLWEK